MDVPDASAVGSEDEQRRGVKGGLTLEEEKTFKDAFAAVMVDTTLGFNVFGGWGGICCCYVTRFAWCRRASALFSHPHTQISVFSYPSGSCFIDVNSSDGWVSP